MPIEIINAQILKTLLFLYILHISNSHNPEISSALDFYIFESSLLNILQIGICQHQMRKCF
jgi:hypothetical protein